MTCFINCCVIGCILKAKEMGDERYGKVICTCSLYIYYSIWGFFLVTEIKMSLTILY
jgi:hypothetical protein